MMAVPFPLSVKVRPLGSDPDSARAGGGYPVALCVPVTSSTSCDQVIFVDHAIDVSLSSDAVQVEIDRLG